MEQVQNSGAHEVHVMIDLETLGLKLGCKILSIGAYVFSDTDLESVGVDRDFYSRLEHTSQTLSVDQSTMDWWAKQDTNAQLEAFGGKTPIYMALPSFSEWMRQLGMLGTVHVWGNAASFDLKILEAAYEHYSMTVPWNYKYEMCYRTLKATFSKLVKESEFQGTKHNALHDAVHQGNHCAKILDKLEQTRRAVYGPET